MTHMPRLLRRAVLAAVLLLLSPSLRASEAQGVIDTRVRVFLDCQTFGCDRNFFITELPFVLWTQDRLDADAHLLVTRLGTASGGGEYTVTLYGHRRFEGRADTLVTTLPPNTTDDVRRRELARLFKLGLVSYVTRLPGQERFAVTYTAPANVPAAPKMTEMQDPWNLWVYRTRLNGGGGAESRASNYEVTGNLTASRITEDWKVIFYFQNEYRYNRFKVTDTTSREYIRRNGDAIARVVRSITDHWSIGSGLGGGYSEFRNIDLYQLVDISAEYNLFPWAEATSRQLVLATGIGVRRYEYASETIYGETEETRPLARVMLAGESRQPWGSIDAALRYNRFLMADNRFSLAFNGRTNIRLTRGLSLEIRGEAAKVNDQLYLPRGGASEDEVLTRQRALATAFRLTGSVGLNFTFGSIYNTIVNPRLEDFGF
ncbi:MAG: hypothetical protein ACKOCV_08005 [Gemmatimonadota bacterium]